MTRCVTNPPTLGDHLPAYTVEYVFGTYYLLGVRYAQLRNMGGLRWRVERLRRCPHELAPVARLALGHGLFGKVAGDAAKPAPTPAVAAFLRALVRASDASESAEAVRSLLRAGSPVDSFRARGAALRGESPSRLRAWLRQLAEIDDPQALAAEAALAHGALAG
jgi:hypothetical protein